MANYNLSANMNLPIPVVGVDPGPDWANNINASLTTLDLHNHTGGLGTLVPVSGLSINADLPMNFNNLIGTNSVRFSSSSFSPTFPNIGCIYISGSNLFYNDLDGNQIAITAGGNVAGTPGSISGLTSPAGASYNSGDATFIFQSAASTAANLDCSSILMRNLISGSNAVTLEPPATIATNYTITLPTLPTSQQVVTLDSSGNLSANYSVDNITIDINSSSQFEVKTSGVTQTQLYTRGRNTSGGVYISASSGTVVGGTGGAGSSPITNMTVSFTTTGRPVMLSIQPATGSIGNIFQNGGTSLVTASWLRDSSVSIMIWTIQNAANNETSAPTFLFCDTGVTAGSHTWQFCMGSNNTAGFTVNNMTVVAYELN